MVPQQKIVSIALALLLAVLLPACSNDTETSEAGGNAAVRPVQKTPTASPPPSAASSPAAPEGADTATSQERPLKIGVIGPETGAAAEYGQHILVGVMAAAKRFNAEGGVAGKSIEVINIDNKGDPGLTDRGVSYLIRQGVIAILSAPTGWSTFGPVHRVNDAKTLFISIGSRRRIERSGPYIFRSALPDELATDELIQYARKSLGYENYALVASSDYSYSLDISSLFKQAVLRHGGTISVEADTYDTYLGTRNLTAVIDAIKKNTDSLQAVIFTGGAPEAVLFAERLKEAGLNLPIIGSEDLFVEDYLKACRDMKGSLVYASYSPFSHSPTMERFKKDVDEAHPDRFSALAYDTFMMLAEAIKAAGSTDSARVRNALIHSGGYDGVTGKTRFTEDGAPVKRPFIYGIKADASGENFVLLKN